ncbi:hypothetical protein GX51_02621 [Blastomyces parvus]|uniref:SMP domain-containing protein n=1 Tax=Blastomyces parvus TaxID=2060905 RepID=A0A2B7XAX2_9EURO|nr:hypothetical protein GX51_02621 [Blastomyces parvus]
MAGATTASASTNYDSYDGEVRKASVATGGKEIDSNAAQQLSSSGRRAQDTRIENKANKSLDEAGALAVALARKRAETKGEQPK